MSAVLKDQPRLATMKIADLDEVLEIECAVYTHSWTRGNVIDSLNAGYHCHTYRLGDELLGYFVLMVAVGEAHLLNLSVSAARQRQGVGSALLREVIRVARERGAANMFLEVRPSNAPALGLYDAFGFNRIGERRGYYPAHEGREDAIVLTLGL